MGISETASIPDTPAPSSGKVIQIRAACEIPEDLEVLRSLASSSGGLINDEVRRIAWPLLLGYRTKSISTISDSSWRTLPHHKDEGQVELDVNRSFIYYPKNESEKQLDRRKEELSSIIIQVLRQHPLLCYFQGFHDIVQVFLLVLGVEHAAEAIAHLSLLRIRDFMLPSLLPSLDHLKLLPSILEAADTKLCQHLSQTQPFFALAATLTLYAHDIQEYGDIARLFDFLIAQPAVVSIYFFANIIISRREELFAIPAEEPEMLHSILSKLPKPLNLEGLVMETMLLFAKHPPEKLPSRVWAKTSYCSVLKTTRASTQNQSLQAGEAFFGMQILQLRRFELRRNMVHNLWKHSRMFGGIGLAIAIGLVSFWFRRRGMEVSPILGTRKLLDSWRLFFR